MNRPIKFRAWDIENKRWCIAPELKELGLVTLNTSPNFLVLQNQNSSLVELNQFTGLLDKNGKEVYEGDIIKVVTKDFDYPDVVNNGEVRFEKGHWEVVSQEDNYYLYGQDEIEVIGNIYSNPELLTSNQ